MNQKEQYQKRIEEAAYDFCTNPKYTCAIKSFKAGAQFVLDNPPTPVVQDDGRFPEIDSTAAYMTEVDAHPKRDVHSQIDWRWIGTWWRKGAMWGWNAARSQQPDVSELISALEKVESLVEDCKNSSVPVQHYDINKIGRVVSRAIAKYRGEK